MKNTIPKLEAEIDRICDTFDKAIEDLKDAKFKFLLYATHKLHELDVLSWQVKGEKGDKPKHRLLIPEHKCLHGEHIYDCEKGCLPF